MGRKGSQFEKKVIEQALRDAVEHEVKRLKEKILEFHPELKRDFADRNSADEILDVLFTLFEQGTVTKWFPITYQGKGTKVYFGCGTSLLTAIIQMGFAIDDIKEGKPTECIERLGFIGRASAQFYQIMSLEAYSQAKFEPDIENDGLPLSIPHWIKDVVASSFASRKAADVRKQKALERSNAFAKKIQKILADKNPKQHSRSRMASIVADELGEPASKVEAVLKRMNYPVKRTGIAKKT